MVEADTASPMQNGSGLCVEAIQKQGFLMLTEDDSDPSEHPPCLGISHVKQCQSLHTRSLCALTPESL